MAWEDLLQEKAALSPEQKKQRDNLARLHAVVFGSGAGADLLKRWHEMHVNAFLPIEASQSALVASNALRKFVRDTERLTAEGRETKA